MPDTPVIPVNSLLRHIQPLEAELVAAATDVVRSGYYVLGPGVNRFESAFADYCGASECIGVANGTDALELAAQQASLASPQPPAPMARAELHDASDATLVQQLQSPPALWPMCPVRASPTPWWTPPCGPTKAPCALCPSG